MTERAFAARVFFSFLVAASLTAPLAARAEAVAAPEKPPAVLPTNHLKTISSQEAAGILGKQVIGAAGEDIGMVVDVLIDSEGSPRAAVIDFGGFLGVGSRKIAVDWTLLQFRPGDHYAPILLDVTGEEIRTAPEYRPSDVGPSVVTAPPAPPALPAGPPPLVGAPTEPTTNSTDDTAAPEMRPPDRSPRTVEPAPEPDLNDEAAPAPEPVPSAPSAPPDAGK